MVAHSATKPIARGGSVPVMTANVWDGDSDLILGLLGVKVGRRVVRKQIGFVRAHDLTHTERHVLDEDDWG